MNNSSDIKWLLHSLCHIEIIEKLSNDFQDYNTFITNYLIVDVIVLHLQQIGELTSRLSKELCEKSTNIDFRGIKGLRNIVVHEYDGIDYNEIFYIIKEELKNLKKDYKNLLINDYLVENKYIEDYINNYLNTRKFI